MKRMNILTTFTTQFMLPIFLLIALMPILTNAKCDRRWCNRTSLSCYQRQIGQFQSAKPKVQFKINLLAQNTQRGIIYWAKFGRKKMAMGAFLEDYICWMDRRSGATTKASTAISSIGKETSEFFPSTTSTAPIPNPIQCSPPKWALVLPAQIRISIQGHRLVQDLALRAGFIEFNFSNNFMPGHINQTVKELIKNSTSLFLENAQIAFEISNWTNKNAEWLQNIKHGAFQYFPIANQFAQQGDIMMLLFECSFGKFIFAPAKHEENFQIEQTFDWKQDFDHIDGCVEKQLDISAEEKKRYMIGSSGKLEFSLNFDVGLTDYGELAFDFAKCEAFKYKYGYTNPLRSKKLAESADDWNRVKSMGRLILPIADACKSVQRFGMRARFRILARRILPQLGLAVGDCDKAREQGNDDCIVCLVKGSFRERTCRPYVECQVMQMVYECGSNNKKFVIRIPRVDGHSTFTTNGTKYEYKGQVRRYTLYNANSGYRRIKVPYDEEEYKLYD